MGIGAGRSRPGVDALQPADPPGHRHLVGAGRLISVPGAIGYMLAGWSQMAKLPPLSIGYVSLIGSP